MSHKQQTTIAIGNLARVCNTTLRAIRWYTQQGLLQSCGMRGQCALYPITALDTVRRIKALQEAGCSLCDIRELFDTITQNETQNKQLTNKLRQVIKKQREAILQREQKLAEIRRSFDQLIEKTDRCDTCQARGPNHDCGTCGNLQALKMLGIKPEKPDNNK